MVWLSTTSSFAAGSREYPATRLGGAWGLACLMGTAVGLFCGEVVAKEPQSALRCPSKTAPRGASPPRGNAAWCEDSRGRRHGPALRWHENAQLETRERYRKGRKHGPSTKWYANGNKLEQGKYRRGRKEGDWQQWREDGTLSISCHFSGGSGPCTETYEDGKLAKMGPMRRGKPHGVWTAWHPDGKQRHSQGAFRKGQRQGSWTFWHEQGTKKSSGTYRKGKKAGAWTWWDKDGAKTKAGSYDGGRETGMWTHWHSNGRPAERGHYEQGLKQGRWKTWDSSSLLLKSAEHERGKRHGPYAEWHVSRSSENPQQKITGSYRDGLREGQWRGWYADGQLQFSGEYKRDKPTGRWKRWPANSGGSDDGRGPIVAIGRDDQPASEGDAPLGAATTVQQEPGNRLSAKKTLKKRKPGPVLPGLWFKTRYFTARLRALLQVMFHYVRQGDGEEKYRVRLTAARLRFDGYMLSKKLTYNFKIGFDGGIIQLHDFRLNYLIVPGWLTVTAGRCLRLTSFVPLREAPTLTDLPITAYSPAFRAGRSLGVYAHNLSTRNIFIYSLGAFNGAGGMGWPELSGLVSVDPDTGEGDITKGVWTNVPTDFKPAFTSQFGLNYGHMNPWDPNDYNGGPLRVATSVGGQLLFDDGVDDISWVASADLLVKYRGFAATARFNAALQFSDNTDGEALRAIGLALEANYMIAKRIQPLLRYALIAPTGPRNDTTELAGGVSVYLVEDILKLQFDCVYLVRNLTTGRRDDIWGRTQIHFAY